MRGNPPGFLSYKEAGTPQSPGATNLRNERREVSYFFFEVFLAAFLAAGFLAAFFFAIIFTSFSS
jgi:hypothetical protein